MHVLASVVGLGDAGDSPRLGLLFPRVAGDAQTLKVVEVEGQVMVGLASLDVVDVDGRNREASLLAVVAQRIGGEFESPQLLPGDPAVESFVFRPLLGSGVDAADAAGEGSRLMVWDLGHAVSVSSVAADRRLPDG